MGQSKKKWGFLSADGFFQPVGELKPENLEYVTKTKAELQSLLEDRVREERYEECCIIRDELAKREK